MQLSLFSESRFQTPTLNPPQKLLSSKPSFSPGHEPFVQSKSKNSSSDTPEPYEQQIEQKALSGLAQCARGYIIRETKENYEIGSHGEKVWRGGTITRKRIGPDLAAIQFILTNLNPEKWQLKPSGISESNEEDPDLSMLSEKALEELAGLTRTDNHQNENTPQNAESSTAKKY